MHKSSLSLDDYGVFPLESDVLGNGPASFGKGVTEKGWKVPRRCPTSFGGGPLEKGHIQLFMCNEERYLAGGLPYRKPISRLLDAVVLSNIRSFLRTCCA